MSKQALYKAEARRRERIEESKKFFEQADQARKEYPGGGCRDIAIEFKIKGRGRDKGEKLLLENGYRLEQVRNPVRTTHSQRKVNHPNRIEGLTVTGINQVVQTDLTYVQVGSRHYYVILLIDVYSRYIVGYTVSRSMQAEAYVRALQQMLELRGRVKGLIHHSDKGRQYISAEYIRLLEDSGIISSMCDAAWKNAYTERLNGTIKGQYLNRWNIESYEELEARTAQAVNHYNTKRKHRSLRALTPASFEASVLRMSKSKRPVMQIYKEQTNNQ